MRILGIYKSKKYLQRILMTITLLMVGFLIVSSAAIYYTSEKTVLTMQRESNEKILAQINFNVANMNELISNMASSLYFDPELEPLMTTKDIHIMDLIKKLNKLDAVVSTSSFLHSIISYNGFSETVYSGGNSIFRRPDSPASAKLKAFLREADGVVKMRLIPLNLFSENGRIDVLSYIMYDAARPYNGKDSVFILNIKPEWLFDNIKLINDLASKQENSIMLIDGDGNLLNLNASQPGSLAKWQAVKNAPEMAKASSSNGYFVASIDGEKSLVSYSDTGISDLRVVTVQPYSAVLSNLIHMRTASLVIMSCFLLVSILVSLWASHKLYRPVQSLMKQIRKYENNDQDKQITDRDELSYASNVYEQAMENLNRAREKDQDKQKTLQQYYLRRLIADSSAISVEQFDQLMKQTDQSLNSQSQGTYRLAVLRISDYAKWKDRVRDISLYKFAISNIAQEMIAKAFDCLAIDMRDDHLVVLFRLKDEQDDGSGSVVLFEAVQEIVRRYYHITVIVALSDPIASSKDITEHYELTLQYSMYSIVTGPLTVILPAMVLDNMENTTYHLPADIEKKWIDGLKTSDLKMLDDVLDRTIAHISKLNYDFMMFSVMQVVVLIKNTLKEMSDNRLQSIVSDLNALSRNVLEIQSLDELRQLFSELFREIAESGKTVKENRNDIITETIKEFIKENYMDFNLSLQGISSMIRVSNDYAGRVFKKNENMSVADYINEVRLQQALRLLESRNDSITDIMEKVGYANQSYFFKLFKKRFGTTPREYRLKKSISQ